MTLTSLQSGEPRSTHQADELGRLLSIKEIYYEKAALNYTRGQDILAQHGEAQLVEVESHWNIPELHGNAESAQDWNRIKRTVLVLGVKKSLQCRLNCRSSDFVAPFQFEAAKDGYSGRCANFIS